MKKTVIRVKPKYIERLKELNHASIGSMADNLHTQPQTIWYNINNNTPTMTRMDWLLDIQRVLKLESADEIVERVEIEIANKHSII